MRTPRPKIRSSDETRPTVTGGWSGLPQPVRDAVQRRVGPVAVAGDVECGQN
jgi:hypothetical protein